MMNKQNEQIAHLSENIKAYMCKNRETMKQILSDADQEVNEMQMKNQTNLNQVTDMSLRAKADLQTTQNKLNEVNQELRTLNRLITERSTQLDKQRQVT